MKAFSSYDSDSDFLKRRLYQQQLSLALFFLPSRLSSRSEQTEFMLNQKFGPKHFLV